MAQWAANGALINGWANDQAKLHLSAAGAGGAIIAWQDFRTNANFDIYAQRVNSAGAIQWRTDGVPISTGIGNQDISQLTADGAGGAIIVWQDKRSIATYDVYAQRVNSAGVAQWTANGVAISTAVGNQNFPELAGDGAGGAIFVWRDERRGTFNWDIYVQVVNGTGVLLLP